MTKKSKNKIKQLGSKKKKSDDYIRLEEENFKLFEQSIKETNWKKVAQSKEEKTYKKNLATSPKEVNEVIDLHGSSLEEAKELLDDLVNKKISSLIEKLTLKIITGKGKHSKEGTPVLAEEIPIYVKKQWKNKLFRMVKKKIAIKRSFHDKGGYGGEFFSF